METDTSVVVRNSISTDHPNDYPDLNGIDEFRTELANEYVSVVRGSSSGAGGWVHILVEVISTFSLSHIIQLLIDGAVYDSLKEGSRSFVLRLFVRAYQRLKARNHDRHVHLSELRIEFQACLLIVHELSSDTILESLPRIFHSLTEQYRRFALEANQSPIEIHVRSSRIRTINVLADSVCSPTSTRRSEIKGPKTMSGIGAWCMSDHLS
jgi:hypothetical protein